MCKFVQLGLIANRLYQAFMQTFAIIISAAAKLSMTQALNEKIVRSGNNGIKNKGIRIGNIAHDRNTSINKYVKYHQKETQTQMKNGMLPSLVSWYETNISWS